MSGKEKEVKIGFVQIIIAAAIFFSVTYLTFYEFIPSGSANFVVPLFKPSGDDSEKIGFVNFDEGGSALVFASVAKAKEDELKEGKTISKKAINKEYIFDFTFQERISKVHGYVKSDSEFYVKAPPLGEHAIILEPYIGFTIIAVVIGFVIMMTLTMIFPARIGIMAALFEETIHHTKTKIRLQTGFSEEIVEILTLPNKQLRAIDRNKLESAFRVVWKRTITESEMESDHRIMFDDVWDDEMDEVKFRNEGLYTRIREYYSEFVETEIADCRDGRVWKNNTLLIGKGIRLYMAHHFSHKFANNVTGMAYGGAAVLIIAVGIRGLKFIPANKPSFILFAIFLEFALLSLMAVTLFYTEEEERTDKMLKRMEDANRSQLTTLKAQKEDIHSLANALVGQQSDIIKSRVENAISDYMTSGDQVQRQIATSIAEKIVFNLADNDK